MIRWAATLALTIAAAGCGGAVDAARESHDRMVRELAAVSERARIHNPFFGTGRVERLRQQVAAAGRAAPWRLRLDAAMGELQLGEERRGIELLAALCRDLREGRTAGDFAANLSANFYLGVGYLRLGETANCCKKPTATTCILPFDESARHTDPEGSTQAIRCFSIVLQNTRPEDRFHLAARWLLNVAHMTLGTWPDEVPEKWRLPAAAFDRGTGDRFENVAIELGLDTFSNAGGVIVDDFDGDARLDILVSDWRPDGALQFYRNRGDGTFEERSAAAGLTGITGGLNLLQADYDNDGDLDFLVLRGAWWFDEGKHPNSLVRNEGDGTFTDVTFLAGLGSARYPTQSGGFADYDLDGDLDLYIGNEHSELSPSPSQLYRNNGDGTFTDVARAAGVTNLLHCKGVHWGDIDNDRDPDLYVSNRDGDNRLYENRGDGTFVDVAAERGVTGPTESFPAFFFDLNNDGALDLFVSNYNTGISHVAAHLLNAKLPRGRPQLHLGNGKGGFREVGADYGLSYPSLPMGANFGDLDQDGWLDLYLGTGDTDYETLVPNLAYRNKNGRGFEDMTMTSGLGHLQKGHGIAFADLDRDGDLDVFAEMGGAYPGDAFGNALFRNPGNDHRWLTLRLVGTTSNRSGIGARLRVVTVEAGKPRTIHRVVNSGGTFGASPLRQTIGLGHAERIERIEIFWPMTGATQAVTGMALDSAIRIVEGRDGFEPLW